MKNRKTLSIIGVGPRGLYALENFILQLQSIQTPAKIHLLLFERTGNFGNGQVYDINQTDTNWINISERVLLLNKRPKINLNGVHIPAFPSYHEWLNKNIPTISEDEPDSYPPRADLGKYLHQRFQSLIEYLLKLQQVTLSEEEVQSVTLNEKNKISIVTPQKNYDDVDEILLTIGHQQTEPSEQINEWNNFVEGKNNIKLFKSPYPIENILNYENLNKNSVIGLRGFGLAMIDVVRGIANQFGKFVVEDKHIKFCQFHSDDNISYMFIPFSLDGLPPAPKPLNAKIDKWFEPTDQQIFDFEKIIENKTTQKKASNPSFLIDAILPIIAEIYLKLPQHFFQGKLSLQYVEKIAKAYLQNNEFEHPIILPSRLSVSKTMEKFIAMATGKEAISLDYCIGQVWRHCQPSIYDKLSFNECNEDVFAKIIELDEGTKRYSYGPPVASIQQMLALVKAGVLNLEMVNNPKISLVAGGWCLESEENSITTDIMINSVLDAPKINSVNSSIIQNLLSNNLIEAVHDELGISTDENAYVISQEKSRKIPIALLGRLAKGTIIGVDAILECFGKRPEQWATEAIKRLNK